MEEVAHLIIRVSADQADNAKAKLKQLGYTAKETETATGGLTSAWKALSGMLAGAVSIGTAVAGLRKLLDVAKQFESLEAQLKTATGTAEDAKVAFSALTDFARTTPYDLAQSVEAFIKLTNLGLTPSERALRSYGDTASAMGKDLSQMVQAVANATTGEFEMLKQFGVKSRTEADGISFSFRGTTEKVKADARSIEEYFIRLGEKNFAGAMTERMETLEGKISNLGDAWDQMFAAISKAGAGETMKQAIDLAIGAIEELTAAIASGQIGAYLDAIGGKFVTLADIAKDAFEGVSGILHSTFGEWKLEGNGVVSFLIAAFRDLPENVRAVVKGVGATFGVLAEYADAAWSAVYDVGLSYLKLLITSAENAGKEIMSHLNPRAKDFDFIKAQADAMTLFAKRTVGAWDETVKRINNATDAYGGVVTEIMNERDAATSSFDAKIKKSGELREEYEKQLRIEKALKEFFDSATGEDPLAKFRKGGQGTTAEFEKLRESLKSQEQLVAESYAKRKQLILDNTAQETALRSELLAQLETSYGEERQAIIDKLGQDVEVRSTMQFDAFALERDMLDQNLREKQKSLDAALAAKLISEDEHQRRSIQLEQRTAAKKKEIDLATANARLELASDFFGNMSAVAGAFGAKGAKIAKAAAIVQTTIKTYESATSAYASLAGIPYVGPALGAAAAAAAIAAGMANVAAIKSSDYAGAYEHGGMIPAGKVGMAQEAGFELVRGPAVVSSARSTADQLAGRDGGAKVSVVVNNHTDAQAQVTERDGADGKVIEIMIKRVEANLTGKVNSGGNAFSSAIERNYGLKRGAA